MLCLNMIMTKRIYHLILLAILKAQWLGEDFIWPTSF